MLKEKGKQGMKEKKDEKNNNVTRAAFGVSILCLVPPNGALSVSVCVCVHAASSSGREKMKSERFRVLEGAHSVRKTVREKDVRGKEGGPAWILFVVLTG